MVLTEDKSVFVDTNILVYCNNKDSSYCKPAREKLDEFITKGNILFIWSVSHVSSLLPPFRSAFIPNHFLPIALFPFLLGGLQSGLTLRGVGLSEL